MESKGSVQKDIEISDNFLQNQEFLIENNEQNEFEEKSNTIEYIRKKIVKIRD